MPSPRLLERPISRPLHFGLGGLAALASGGTALTPLPIHSTLVFDGDSNMQGANGVSLMYFLLQFAYGMGVPIYNANRALAGDTTSEALANLSGVTNTGAKILVEGVGRNDLYSITSANKDAKLAAAKTNIEAIWDTVLAGKQERVLHLGLVPVSDNYANWDDVRQSAWLELNDWIVRRNGDKGGRVYTVNLSGAGWNSATDYYTDDQHLGYLGAYKGGRVAGPVLRQIMGNVPAFYADPSDFGSILPSSSAALTGASGSIWSTSSESVSGQVANNCVVGLGSGGTRGVNVAGVSVVCSKEVDAKGFNIQRCDVTMTEENPGFELYFLVAIPGAGSYTNATRYYSKMRGQLESADNVERFDGGTWTYTGTTSYNANIAYASYAFSSAANLPVGYIDEADFALSAGLANTGGSMSRLWATGRVVFRPGEGQATVRFSRPSVIPFSQAETS